MAKKIIAIDENKNTLTFNNLDEATKMISKNSKLEDWKIQLYIAYALCSHTRAFKYKWVEEK